MAATKVLVVDDSLTMRALISGALERIPNVEVVGLADGVVEARALRAQHRPDVITLDIEMPGMSGLEYLAEVMGADPMPIIMFSTRTQAGAADSIEALRLGAIDCFPKPRVATPAELDKIIVKLGKRIKSAKSVDMKPTAPAKVPAAKPIDWNGRLLSIGADASNTKALFDLFASFPVNCPPTVVVQHLGADLASSLVATMDEQVAPRVVLAEDGMALEQGTIYVAAPGEAHVVVDQWPAGKLRLLARDPVAGERPSISVLFASVAKAAGADSIGLFLMRENEDGAAGLKAVDAAGGYSISPTPGGQPGFVLARRMMSQPIPAADLSRMALKLVSR